MFIVLEVQSNIDGTVGTIVNSYETEQQAAAAYHTALAAGATSNVYKHAAFVLSDDGYTLKSEGYTHQQ